jgi:hypothetical protein
VACLCGEKRNLKKWELSITRENVTEIMKEIKY